MPKSYTENDLILFIYNELTEKEKFGVQKALDSDPELHKTYHMLLQVVGSLDTLNYEPDPSSVEIILEHSHHEEHFH
jgi:hypothetical protein